MKQVVVIGCGFGGISCCTRLRRYNRRRTMEITVIDPRCALHFLPCLPDLFGRGLSASCLTYDIEPALKKMGCNFIRKEVSALDLEKREVSVGGSRINYDYLVISSGSETNFYGNDALGRYGYKLDSVDDGLRIKTAVREGNYDVFMIGGGGYTGIESAAGLRLYLEKISLKKRVIIIERAPSILGALPEWMRDYTLRNLKRMEVEVVTNGSIEKIEDRKIRLASGDYFENAMLIWAAGVRTAPFIQKLACKKSPQGRLEVDQCLRLNGNAYAVGDVALFKYQDGFLRMAVQFSIAQGKYVAANIARSICGRPLRRYRPRDLGFIIPMANNFSCGRVLGVNVRGWLATALHYGMCIYRTYGLKNRLRMIRDLIKGGV